MQEGCENVSVRLGAVDEESFSVYEKKKNRIGYGES